MLSVLLAANELPDPKSAEATGWIIIILSGLFAGVYYVLMLWKMLFPKEQPPAHERYATKDELEKARKEHQDSDARIEARFETWMTQQQAQHEDSMSKFDEAIERFAAWQLTMERALGVIGTKADIALEAKGKK